MDDLVWLRLVKERVVSMTEIENGTCDWVDCLRLHAVLDMDAATAWKMRKEAERK